MRVTAIKALSGGEKSGKRHAKGQKNLCHLCNLCDGILCPITILLHIKVSY